MSDQNVQIFELDVDHQITLTAAGGETKTLKRVADKPEDPPGIVMYVQVAVLGIVGGIAKVLHLGNSFTVDAQELAANGSTTGLPNVIDHPNSRSTQVTRYMTEPLDSGPRVYQQK